MWRKALFVILLGLGVLVASEIYGNLEAQELYACRQAGECEVGTNP